VVERFSGPAIASQCAKSMLIDVSQTTQTPYLPLLADVSHTTPSFTARSIGCSRTWPGLCISELAAELAVSERTPVRRFSAVLDRSPLTYLQHLRIDSARAPLEASDLGVDQIAMQVGYNDASSFSRLFRERLGRVPQALPVGGSRNIVQSRAKFLALSVTARRETVGRG
jgi:transcriptional regulator GlxA family with amidase domain